MIGQWGYNLHVASKSKSMTFLGGFGKGNLASPPLMFWQIVVAMPTSRQTMPPPVMTPLIGMLTLGHWQHQSHCDSGGSSFELSLIGWTFSESIIPPLERTWKKKMWPKKTKGERKRKRTKGVWTEEKTQKWKWKWENKSFSPLFIGFWKLIRAERMHLLVR